MKGRKTLSVLFSAGLITAFTFLLIVPALHADEIRYPVPCYEGEELQKIRQWEKLWAGKKIDNNNIDGVKELVPESLYKLYKNPGEWGESWFEIIPYKYLKPTEGDIAYTKKYAGTCSIGDGDKLLNHVCGIPFPEPKTALEIVYNFDNMNLGDNLHTDEYMWLVDGRKKYDRKMIMESRMMYFAGRREVTPTPEMEPNKKKIFRATHSEYLEPASMKGTRGMSIKWKDRTRDYGSWSFSSATRRITRRSTAQRQTALGGTDLCSDDSTVYGFAIPYLNYKLVGRKELLIPRRVDIDQIKALHKEGVCQNPGYKKERITTYVIEAHHKEKDYMYSKMIWYIDPETWYILYADKYDRQGKLWKIFDMGQAVKTSVFNKAEVPIIEFSMVADVQRTHSTGVFTGATIGEKDETFLPDYYEPRALLRHGY